MEKRLESIDLNLLVALHWLLTERSVTAAANRIGLSQPAMSRALGRLRDIFDDPLLVKSGAAMQLTPMAERLQSATAHAVERCRDVFRATENFAPETAAGAFRIACVDYTGVMVADAWAGEVRPAAPAMNLEIVDLTIEASRDLVSGKIDLVIMPDPSVLDLPPGVDIDQFVRRKVIPQNYLCALRKDHPDAGKRMTLKKYVALDHILVAPEGAAIGIVDRALAHKGLERRIAYLTFSFLLALPILQSTDCVITAPDGLLAIDADRLVTFPPPVELGLIDLYAGWHPNWTHDKRHRWVRGKLFEALARDYARRAGATASA